MEIHVLKAQGLSERQIARQPGVSRNTVARYLESTDTPRYKIRDARPTKLDAFRPYVERRIKEAAPDWIPAPAMLRELRALGYTGQMRQLQEFMKSCKPWNSHTKTSPNRCSLSSNDIRLRQRKSRDFCDAPGARE
jgi:transposase